MTETQNFELSNDIVIEDLVKHEALVKEMKERITRQKRPNKAMAHLRKKKKQCKAARIAL